MNFITVPTVVVHWKVRDCPLKLKTNELNLYQIMITYVPEKELTNSDSYVEEAIAAIHHNQ